MLPEGGQFRGARLSFPRAVARYGKQRLKQLGGGPAAPGPDTDHPAYSRMDALGRNLYGIFHQTILPTLLRNYDRYSMAHGVEIRMPMMDHRLVSYAFSLPSGSKLRSGFTKRILRDAAAPFMPREIAYRQGKIGFNSPILDWMKGPWKEMFLDILESRDFRECALIDRALVAREVRSVITGSASFRAAEQAWTDIAPYFWERGLKLARGRAAMPSREGARSGLAH